MGLEPHHIGLDQMRHDNGSVFDACATILEQGSREPGEFRLRHTHRGRMVGF
jgi:hypothetical protein